MAFLSPRRLVAMTACLASLASACEGLIGADFGRPRSDAVGEGGTERDPGSTEPCVPSAHCRPAGDAAAESAPPVSERYADAQKRLAAARVAGPTTSSSGFCTATQLFWNESDGTVHAWTPAIKGRIDYAFKLAPYPRSFYGSSAFVVASRYASAQLAVYRADQPDTLVTSIAYAPSFVGTPDGVVRLDRVGVFPEPDGILVRRWNAASGTIEDLTTRLETTQPHSSFGDDVLVIPAGVTPPFALWMVNVVKKKTTSVTLEVGSLQESAHGAGGLVVAYGRSSGGPGLRVYLGDKDDAASVLDLGAALASRGHVLVDATTPEHDFLVHVATWGQRVIYGSARGIWSYDLATGALAPVQLNVDQKVGTPDLLCVIKAANLLVYRMLGDTQIWTVPLS